VKRFACFFISLLAAFTALAHFPPANVEVSAGSHQLEAVALLPSGLFSTNTINSFTCTATNQVAIAYFDGGGFPTNHVWKIGTNVVRTLGLTWDAKGSLLKGSDRDSSQNERQNIRQATTMVKRVCGFGKLGEDPWTRTDPRIPVSALRSCSKHNGWRSMGARSRGN